MQSLIEANAERDPAKISKINLRLFLFNLAGTFGARQTMNMRNKKNRLLHAFSCQYLINVQSQNSSSREETLQCHCLLFSRIEFRTIEFYNSRFFVINASGGNRAHNAILDDDCRGEQLFDDGISCKVLSEK